jgi:hypothetical protein
MFGPLQVLKLAPTCSDVMHKVADKDSYIMVTWANNHYYDFVKNWVAHVEGLGISSFVIGAMDHLILAQLLRDGIPCFSMESNLTTKDYGWGTPTFHKMVCAVSTFSAVFGGAKPLLGATSLMCHSFAKS